MNNTWFLIINPNAGNGKFVQHFEKIKLLLKEFNIKYLYQFTEEPKQEYQLVQRAIAEGHRNFMVVGGDGTLHHIVNGIMEQHYCPSTQITLSVLPQGTGNDWVKTHNIPHEYREVLELMNTGNRIQQDIGLIELETTKAYFANVAGIGYDAYVVKKLKKLKRLGPIAYLISGLWGLFFYKKTRITVQSENQHHDFKTLMTLFGICRYSAGGMQLTAYSSFDNGLLDISHVQSFSVLELLLHLPQLYSGRIVKHRKVRSFKTTKIKLTPSVPEHTYLQADGELIGKGPAVVSLVPKAINFISKA